MSLIFYVQWIIRPVGSPWEVSLAKVLFYLPHGHWLRPSSFLFGILVQPSIWFPWHLSSSAPVHSSCRHCSDLTENNSHGVTSFLKDLSWKPVVHGMNCNPLRWAYGLWPLSISSLILLQLLLFFCVHSPLWLHVQTLILHSYIN